MPEVKKEKTTNVELYVKTKVKFTEEDVDSIICAAIEGGISYWCKKVTPYDESVGSCFAEYVGDQVSKGCAIVFHIIEDKKKVKLTMEKFIEGLQKYISLGNYHCISNGRLDTYKMDSGDADGIIQCALFGGIIYG